MFSQEIGDFMRFCGISWENLGVIFCVFVRFPGFLGGNGWGFPGRAWGNLGGLRRTWADLDGVSLNIPRICKTRADLDETPLTNNAERTPF